MIKKWFEFAESASGDLELQPVLQAIAYCANKSNKIDLALFKSIDRFTRGGTKVYLEMKSQFIAMGVFIQDSLNTIKDDVVNTLEHTGFGYKWSQFSPSKTNEILAAENAQQEATTILTRMIGAEIEYVQEGYRVRPAPYGFVNKKVLTASGDRTILAPHPEESEFIVEMFELRAQGNLSDTQIIEKLNKKGFRTRTTYSHEKGTRKLTGIKKGVPLSVKQLQRYISRTIYAGYNIEKWTHYLPVKTKFPGLVEIELFNRANKGKVIIIEDKETETASIIKGKTPEWLLKKNKDNPLFAFKKQVLCPICKRPLKGSSPRTKSGKYIRTYHCSVQHKYWGINAEKFDGIVSSFVKHVRFTKDFRDKFQNIVFEEWDKRKEKAVGESISSQERVTKLKQEQLLLIEKAKTVTSVPLVKSLEDDINELELKIAQATDVRNDKESDELDIKMATAYCKYYMEHLEDLILSGTDTMRNAAMFGLVFEVPPTFDELKDGTPKLAHIFELNEAYKTQKNLSVTPLEFESKFPE